MYRREQFLQQHQFWIKLRLSQANLRFEDTVVKHSFLYLIVYVVKFLRD